MAKRRKSKFRGKVGADAQRQRQQGAVYGYLNLPSGLQVFKDEPGKRATFDILPYVVTEKRHPDRDDEKGIAVPGELWYKRPFRIHRNVGVNNDAVVCPTSVGRRCPICDYRNKRMQEGAEQKEIDALKSSLRNLYVVVPKGHPKYEEKPHVWDISQAMFQKLLNEELEDNDEYEAFPDLEEGFTLKVRFDSRTIGAGKPFSEASRIDFLEREEQYDEGILKKVPELDALPKILSYAQLEALFFELDDEEAGEAVVDEEPEDDVPLEPPSKPRRSRTEQDADERVHRHAEEPEDDEGEPPWKQEAGADEEDLCVACEGEGVNTKGNKCRICGGTGRKSSEKAEERPARSKRPERTKPKEDEEKPKDKDKCPHGHRFGIDCEEHDDCDECILWDECIEAKGDE